MPEANSSALGRRPGPAPSPLPPPWGLCRMLATPGRPTWRLLPVLLLPGQRVLRALQGRAARSLLLAALGRLLLLICRERRGAELKGCGSLCGAARPLCGWGDDPLHPTPPPGVLEPMGLSAAMQHFQQPGLCSPLLARQLCGNAALHLVGAARAPPAPTQPAQPPKSPLSPGLSLTKAAMTKRKKKKKAHGDPKNL